MEYKFLGDNHQIKSKKSFKNNIISQQKSLHLALNQLNDNNFVPHSEVVKMSAQWLRM